MPTAITQNPYRILGIKANATAPEKQAAKNSMAAFLKIGSLPSLPFDSIENIQSISRTENMIEVASNQILDDNDKIINAIFWFLTGGITDEITIGKLINGGSKEEVFDVFYQTSKSERQNISKYSASINFSTLAIINFPKSKDENLLLEAIQCKYELCASRNALTVIGNNLQVNEGNINHELILQEVLFKLIGLLKELFPSVDEFKLINQYFSKYNEVLEQSAKLILKKLNTLVEETIAKRKKLLEDSNVSNVYAKVINVGISLFDESRYNLNQISQIFGTSSIQTQNAYETVYDEINHCVIYPYNQLQTEFERLLKAKNSETFMKTARSLGVNVFDSSVRLLENSLNFSKGISFTIKSTMQTNLNGIREFQDYWKENYIKFTEGGSGGDTDGCLTEAFGSIIVRIVVVVILGFLLREC